MNPLIIEYGIQTEDSTHRIHVDVIGKKVFVYKTQNGIDAMPEPISIKCENDWNAGDYYIIYPKWANGMPTARGIRIKHTDIKGCISANIPEKLIPNNSAETTSEKGKAGVVIVVEMLQSGLLPLQFTVTEINDLQEQISGQDLHADKLLLQVKFDYGASQRGLFMQTHERNLYGMH